MITGSSTPTRGIPIKQVEEHYDYRFIPAHAGNTISSLLLLKSCEVHPRPCGEYMPSPCISLIFLGSPPPMRGIPTIRHIILNIVRFTPAHAGNTCRTWRNRGKHKVHPRSRGEYLCPIGGAAVSPVSSPLTRGIHVGITWKNSGKRFIPAHAGNTAN